MERQVFHDPSGRRGRLVMGLGAALFAAAIGAAATVVYGALVAPKLPTVKIELDAPPAFDARPLGDPSLSRAPLHAAYSAALPLPAGAANTPRFGFIEAEDPASLAAFRRQQHRLDGVIVAALTTRRADRGAAFALTSSAQEFLREDRAALGPLQVFLSGDLSVANALLQGERARSAKFADQGADQGAARGAGARAGLSPRGSWRPRQRSPPLPSRCPRRPRGGRSRSPSRRPRPRPPPSRR